MKRTEMPPRRTRLQAKTPQPRVGKQLIRTGRLRFRSARTERVYRQQRRPLVSSLLAEFPWCQWPGCQRRSVDVHELKSRARGGSITNPANCRAVCREHHEEIGRNPAAARDAGWLLNSWDEEPK